MVKAIRYPGNAIHVSKYVDAEDFSGSLRKVFDDSLAFVMRNLYKVQAGRGVNAPGTPEIPEAVFEELLVNALVHRDYLVSAPIRLFIFDNRIEIIRPGHLPDNLTVENIRAGNSNLRNPILVSYVAKGLLPYHGLGSGIKRALEEWPEIGFLDDRDGSLFTATVHRTAAARSVESSVESSGKTRDQILDLLATRADLTIVQVAQALGLSTRAIEKQIVKLQQEGLLRRVGPRKSGRWEVLRGGGTK